MVPNKLLTYIFQCRSKEFIEHYTESLDKPNSSDLLYLYNCCCALEIVLEAGNLGEEYLSEDVIEYCRKGCHELKEFICSQIEIPNNYEKTFYDFLRNYQYYPEERRLEDILNGDIEELKSQDYREVDCLLYEAGMKLHFDEMMDYLEKGGDPHVYITADIHSSEVEALKYNGFSLYGESIMRIEDLFMCYSFRGVLKRALNKIDVELSLSQIHGVFWAAAYQIVLNKIDDFERNKK